MRVFSPRQLLNADRWSRLFFTTYALSLSFFEAVVVDAMYRQQIDDALILADADGVRSAMNEPGAQGVGQSYDLEPIAVQNGCFHAKFSYVGSKADAHLIVGSGNLTFGGWGANVECIEHLHPSFAPDCFVDAGEFLKSVATSPRLRHSVGNRCLELSQELIGRARGKSRDGKIRLIHNIDKSITNQLTSFAQELGGATSLKIAAPFFDNTGVWTLCSKLGLESAFVHVHGTGSVMSQVGLDWPAGKSEAFAQAVCLEFLSAEERRLHAKLYEIVCRRGRIVVSGSSNATKAGLENGSNVELCVVRIQREPVVGWRFTPTSPPTRQTTPSNASASQASTLAVLRGTLSRSRIAGTVISEFPTGEAVVSRKNGLTWEQIGHTTVSPLGDFEVGFGEGWTLVTGGQFLIALKHTDDSLAQGFISLPEQRAIAKRLGAPSSHFYSLLQNRETPADVAAILDFLYLHPEWLPKPKHFSGGTSGERVTNSSAQVDLDVLRDTERLLSLPHKNEFENLSVELRFMSEVFAAFAERRGPIDASSRNQESDLADTEEEGARETNKDEVAKADREASQALVSFERLLGLLLDGPPHHRQPVRAAQIAQYVIERLQVDAFRVTTYLEQLIRALDQSPVLEEDGPLVRALILLWASQLHGDGAQNSVALRRQILRVFGRFTDQHPTLELVEGFAKQLESTCGPGDLWTLASQQETIQEEIRRFSALNKNLPPPSDFPRLAALPEWNTLQRGSTKNVIFMKKATNYCPACYLGFSSIDASRLRNLGIASCRGKILLCEEF